jgi:predicted transcriptional regulator
MAMTLRLPPDLESELRAAAAEDHRSMHQAAVHAVEMYLAQRETAEIKADPDALRALAEARQAVRQGEIVYGPEAVYDLVRSRDAS